MWPGRERGAEKMQLLVQSILTGILLGGLYALIGVGLSLVFGIMGLTNIAHGDFMIMSAFMIMSLTTAIAGSLILGMLLTIVFMMIFGVIVQNFLVNRVIDSSAESALLVTFGLSIVIKNVLEQIYGADTRIIHTPWAGINVISTPWVSISAEYLINFLVAVAVVLLLSFVIKKTYLGRSIRAASSNTTAAELMGVNTKKIYVYTMCIAMITVCIAGVLVGSTFVFVPSSSTTYMIIAFGVVVIGGMGSITGTLLGGVILGLAQLLGGYFFGSGYQNFVGYIAMLIILTFRPRGLLGNMTRK